MNQKLFIRNLSWSVSENDLYDLFSQAGAVVSVKIPTRQEDGKPKGFAFIEMGSPDAAQQAIRHCNGTMLYDRDIVVNFSDDSIRTGSSRLSSGASPKNAKLFVRNIGYSSSESELQGLFEKAGTVLSVKIPTDRDTGNQKGFAFIEMSSVSEAEQAINTLNNSYVDGKEIVIDYQDPNRSKSRPSQGGGYNRGGGYEQGGSGRW
jgi:nucleolin